MIWWNLIAKYWEVLGLGSTIAVVAAALSVKKAMCISKLCETRTVGIYNR